MSSISSIGSVGAVQPPAAVDFRGRRRDDAAAPTDPSTQKNSGSTRDSEKITAPTSHSTRELSPAEERRVKELAEIDQRVRAHEAAHQAAAGSMGGAVSFSFETGPDGKSYAVGGEVPVDLSSGRTPEETIAKAQQVRAAALAPADPSPQDLAVAAEASQIEAMARSQLAKQQLRGDAAEPVFGAANDSAGDVGRKPNQSPAAPRSSGQKATAALDVGAQALATVSALEAERAANGASQAQVQYIARLASSAYERM